MNLSHFTIITFLRPFAYLFYPLAHYCHPNHFFIIKLPINSSNLSFILFLLLSLLSNYQPILMTLLIAHRFIHPLTLLPRPDLYHSSYLATFSSYLHLPFFNQPIFTVPIFSHHLLLIIILNTYRLQNLLTFQYHFIIFYLHLHLCFFIHPCGLELAIRIQPSLLHFRHPHELILLQIQHHLQLIRSRFVPLPLDSISRKDHFSRD